MTLEEGDITLCTVDRIAGTLVFVNIDGEEKDGSIVLSEIAPGRIRNLRDYVVPKKKIICKVLSTKGETIKLSLRRVTKKEQKEMREKIKQEKSFSSLLKRIIGEERAKKAIKEIKEKEKLYEFVEEIKESPKKLEKVISKEDAEKVLEILNKQKTKKAILKKDFTLTTTDDEGLKFIKEILGKIKKGEIKYISAGKYSVKTEADDIKKADNKIKEIFEEIEKFAKKNSMDFSTKEK